MFLCSLQVVLTVECLPMFLLQLLILSFHQLKLVLLLLKSVFHVVHVHLHLLQFLEVNVALLADHAVLLLELFVLLGMREDILLALVLELGVVLLNGLQLSLKLGLLLSLVHTFVPVVFDLSAH